MGCPRTASCGGGYASLDESRRFWGRFGDAALGALFTAGVFWVASYAQPHGGIGSLREAAAAGGAAASLARCDATRDAGCGALLWPLPAAYEAGDATLCVDDSLAFALDDGARASAVVRAAVDRYAAYLFPHGAAAACDAGAPTLATVAVSVDDADDGYPSLDADVGYELDVGVRGGAALRARTVWGALHGLETLSQLVAFRRATRRYEVAHAPARVVDAPRFAYRGVMVDVARHFIPLAHLRKVVDAMAFSKLNVLHLHLSDQESWPVESLAFPALWDSAFSDDEVYARRELREFVAYARLRGVAVLPEFDAPGHSKAACRGAPADVCMASCASSNWPLRPTNRTLDFLAALYDDVYGGDDPLFPFAFGHVGGDEVKYDCWDADNVSAAWLEARNLTSREAYLLVLNTNARLLPRRAIAWDDAFYDFRTGVDADVAVMFWSSVAGLMQEAADAGHRVVAAPSTPLYLSSDSNWGVADVYNYDPCDPANPVDSDNTVNGTACRAVLGLEAAAWGEAMDASTLVATLFPRAAAAAERAWSDRDLIAYTNFSHGTNVSTAARLGHHRCRLLARGVAAGPVAAGWKYAYGGSAPGAAGSCLYQ